MIWESVISVQKVILVKPLTYMNNSGHNGIKSIIQHLGHQDFMRVRVGVGEKPKGYDLADYVLGHYSDEEKPVMDRSFLTAAEAAVFVMNEGVDKAMNKYN